MRTIRTIALHHTASSDGATFEDIRTHHVHARGWSDIGYHFLVWADGTVRLGRPIDRQGAHVAGHNLSSAAVAFVGNFASPYDREPPAAQWAQALELVHSLCRQYGVTVDNVKGHNEFDGAATACPGFNPRRFRDDLRARFQQGGTQ